ncbi:ceramidase domain-containing protein [Maritimibacter fusiformis]|uniref:Ceramidase n=1 Tax=Maritimibacter fusiformis TaxID=2603819 RepID=A0A5D0RNH3_9RHOB|nr:ceramidase domain-containing protein [Maritimibacter fusiformis]TYB83137.1 ceramidase [Maritimibacter fusiformis]
MDWMEPVDGYCERLDAAFWAEPLNAATNLAFLVAAAVMAWRLRGARLPYANILIAILTAIGIGSFLFHTFATRWAGLADTLPILLFILAYIFAATRDFLGASPRLAALAVAAFFPFAALTVPLFALIPGLGSSAGYAPVPVLLLGYAVALRRRAPDTARNMALAGALLIVSLTFRTLDAPLCAVWPPGTHFVWHILNGLLLGWLIETYRRHMLAGGRGQG